MGINNCDMMKVSLVKGNKRKAFPNYTRGDTLTTVSTLHHWRGLGLLFRDQIHCSGVEIKHMLIKVNKVVSRDLLGTSRV